MTEPSNPYIAAVPARLMFVDETYQRPCQKLRAKDMSRDWNPALAGVLDVSDRGEDALPRYAIVNGQHRWAAASLVDPEMHLVVNVHRGLTVAGEAKLFDDIDRKTKSLTNWDRWKARRAAGDPTLAKIDEIAARHNLVIDPNAKTGNLRCITALEVIFDKDGDGQLLADTLSLIVDTWGVHIDSLEGSIVHGVAIVIDTYQASPIFNSGRLGDAMEEVTPRQSKSQAQSLREFEKGTLAVLVAKVLVRLYNKTARPGQKLDEQVLR